MEHESVLAALRFEAGQLIREMANLSEDQWRLPTRCTPWKVNDLLAHVRVVLAWLPGMLIAPEPAVQAEASAAEYYRADDRFSPDTNTTRIAIARDLAASKLSGAALAADFAATWQLAEQLCRAEPDDRVVLTRHGDLMLLSEFLLTRVVEVAVPG